MSDVIATRDSWVNAVTGVGGAQDKSAAFAFVPGMDALQWDAQRLSDLYETDDVSAIVVDTLPDEAFQSGWSLKTSLDAKQNEAVRDAFDKLKVRQCLQSARKWSRLMGGGGVYIGSDDGDQVDGLKLGGNIHFLAAYDRDELQPARYYDDPLKPNFGKVSHYRLTPVGSVRRTQVNAIHESRFVIFDGVEVTPRQRARNNGWGNSVLLRPMNAIRQFNAAHATVLALLADVNQNVYKMSGLADMLLAGGRVNLEERMKAIDEFRSVVKGILIDAEDESFERSQLNVSGIEGLLDKYTLRLTTALRMPLSKFTGQTTGGLGATGEGDQRDWNRQVQTEQSDVFQPALERVARILFSASNGPTDGVEPDTWSVEWQSLWEPTDKEKAEVRNIDAQTDDLYTSMGALTVSAVTKARFSGETTEGPLMSADEIAAMGEVAALKTEGAGVPALGEGDPEELDTEDAPEDEGVAQLASAMTEHRVKRCEHDKPNRCRICGVERVRALELDANGAPSLDDDGRNIWVTHWRPIGTYSGIAPATGLPAEEEPDA